MEPDFQDSLVTSSEDVIQIENGTLSERKLLLSDSRSARKKKNKEVNERFPWLRDFQKLSRTLIGNVSIKVLLNLITLYTEHVSRDVSASYSKPNRAAKVKQSMINVITLFHICYTNINAPLDEGIYMEKMSNLLTMYMDMEIKASRRGKESVQRVASKIISSLFIVLNNSPEHILDTILNARFITVKKFSEICIPIFKKVTRDLQPYQDITYVRCLLIFKLWKRLVARGEERNSLNRLAVTRLSPPPPQLLEMIQRGLMTKVLPILPPNKKPALVTRFYLLAKFNLRNSIKALMKLKTDLSLNELTTPLDSSTFFEDPFVQDNLLVSEDMVNPKLMLEDCSFLDSGQDTFSECTMSDSALLDVILCDDSPRKSKKHIIPKADKDWKKMEKTPPRKNIEKNTSKKQGIKVKNKTKLSNTNDHSFTKLPMIDHKQIKLNSYHLSEDQSSNKASPSSTVNDESVSVNQVNEVLTNNHKTQVQVKEICEAITKSSKSESSKSNVSTIKKETEDKTLVSCQQFCSNVSQEKYKQLLDSKHLINNPKLMDQNQEGSDAEGNNLNEKVLENVFTDYGSENNNVKIKYESKRESDRNAYCTASSHKDSSVHEFNNDKIAANSFKLLESISKPKETKPSSDCSKQNKSTQVFENVDNSVKINHTSTIICNTAEETVDNLKTKPDFVIPCKLPNEACGQVSTNFNLKTPLISQNTTNVYEQLTCNNSPTETEEPKDAMREFSVLSYIPKSACETPTTRPTRPINDCVVDSAVTPQIIIKSEKAISDNNSIKHKLSVKKEFNCKRDVDNLITSSKFNRFLDNEQTHNPSQDCISNTLSSNKVCDQGLSSKQTAKNDINSCLLHNILGEDDCLKNCSNECLLKKTTSNKILPIEDSQNCNMKNLLDSSEQECISIADWGESSTAIKKEIEFESKSLNSIFYENKPLPELNSGGSNSNDGFLKNDLQCLPLKNRVNALDYQLGQISENVDIDCDYESGDSNLVIDEDIDPFQEQIEDVLEDQTINCISDSNNLRSGLDSTTNFQESKPIKELFDTNFYAEEVHKGSVEGNNTSLTTNKDISRGVENKKQYKPTTLARNSFQESAKYNVDVKNSMLLSKGNVLQRDSVQCESSLLGIKSCAREQKYASSKVKENTNLNCQQAKQLSNLKNDSSYRMSQEKISTCLSASSKLVEKNNPSFAPKINDTNFNQPKHIELKKEDSFISLKEVPPSLINKTQMTLALNESQQTEKFTHCNSDTILFNRKKNIPPVGHSHQAHSGVNNFQNLIKKSETHGKVDVCRSTNINSSLRLVSGELSSPGSCVQNVQSGSVKYANNKLTDSQNYSKKPKPVEVITMKSNDVFNQSDVVLDTLCMSVKPAPEPREFTDFEFNVFPVAHEVEVYSATEAMLGDFVCPGPSEIGHPDWPIANEQNVIDSSNLVSYSSTQDQYLYTANMSSEQCYALSEMNQNSPVNSLELQQVSVDFVYPDNTASYPNKEEFNLHFKTLEMDYNLCCSQLKFKEFYLAQDIPPTIPVPFPPQGRLDNMKSSVRCTCEQCSDNHQKLLSNYNILTQFRNSKVRPLNIYCKSLDSSLSDQNCESDCSLPLKKRKTLTNSKSTEESVRLEGELLSYPNTPMISIAQLELTSFEQQNQIVSANQSHWNDASAYTAAAQNPLNLAHYSSLQQPDLTRQVKNSKSRPNKRRKSSR